MQRFYNLFSSDTQQTAGRLMNSISDRAGSSLKEIQKKVNYSGDVVFFETGGDYQDEDIK